MHTFIAIAGAVTLFILFLFVLALIILCLFALYFRIRDIKLEYHKRKIRRQWEKEQPQMGETHKRERRKIEIVPEELYAVTQEEYEADMMRDAPHSPLDGCDLSRIEEQLSRNQSSLFRPAQN